MESDNTLQFNSGEINFPLYLKVYHNICTEVKNIEWYVFYTTHSALIDTDYKKV